MCEKCRQKHTKIFWLDQIYEMEYTAKKISETLQTTHPWIQSKIDDFEIGAIESKEKLAEEIYEVIKNITVPRENAGKKYVEQNLFQ